MNDIDIFMLGRATAGASETPVPPTPGYTPLELEYHVLYEAPNDSATQFELSEPYTNYEFLYITGYNVSWRGTIDFVISTKSFDAMQDVSPQYLINQAGTTFYIRLHRTDDTHLYSTENRGLAIRKISGISFNKEVISECIYKQTTLESVEQEIEFPNNKVYGDYDVLMFTSIGTSKDVVPTGTFRPRVQFLFDKFKSDGITVHMSPFEIPIEIFYYNDVAQITILDNHKLPAARYGCVYGYKFT